MGWGSGWGIGPWGACIAGGPDTTPPVISLFMPNTIVFGSASTTEAQDTSSASGTAGAAGTVFGSILAREAMDTSSAIGNFGAVGSAATTEAMDTSSAIGNFGAVGSAATTEAMDTSSAAGTFGAAGFNYLDLTFGTCLLWLDASDASTLQVSSVDSTPVVDGGEVGHWVDKSGLAHHGNRTGTGTTRSDGSMNGNRGVAFNGSGFFYTPAFALTQPCTIYAVAYATGGVYPFVFDGASYNTRDLYFLNTTTFEIYSGAQLDNTIASQANPAVLCGVFDSVSSVNRYNATETMGSIGNTAETGGAVIGAQGGGGYPLTGVISAILVYDGAHTLSQRNAIQNALKSDWGTP